MSEKAEAEIRKENPRILCVAEAHDELKSLVYLLKTQKYRVVAAQNIIKALEVITNEEHIEMLVLDLRSLQNNPAWMDPDTGLPELPGRLLAEAVRAKFGPVPILFVTAENMASLAAALDNLANSKIMDIPFRPTLFLASVESGLKGGYQVVC